MKAVLLISHGSRYDKTIDEVRATLDQIAKKTDVPILEYAFLELQSPDIPEGIERCIQRGADEILVLLNFLNAGRHIDGDIPRIISQAQSKHPRVSITISKPLGHHSRIVEVFADIIKNS